jgi:hypothetical protein
MSDKADANERIEYLRRVHSLHRYFLNASTLRRLYRSRAEEFGLASGPADSDWVQQFAYLSLWYGSLYVVAEGWLELSLSSPKVEILLSNSENLGSLRRFRNGVFHFQRNYWDDRITDFIGLGAGSAVWINSLHKALGDDLLARLTAATD